MRVPFPFFQLPIAEKFRLIAGCILLLGITALPLFGHLDTLPIRIWDEARLAVSALEMYFHGNYLVPHFEGYPDMWSTKPPLMIWLQVLGMKILGPGELAVRLPSALAAFFTCLLLFIFSYKYLKSMALGIIAVLVLITADGYVNIHATRTGDYDALLTLFTTGACLAFFAFTETKRNIYLYACMVGFMLGVLTKGVAPLLFLPALIAYTAIFNFWPLFLKNKHFFLGIIVFLIPIALYYGVRELQNPGYLAAVADNELGGRYLKVLDEHKGPFSYYFDHLVDYRFSDWHLFIPCGIAVGLLWKNKKINRLTIFSFLASLGYFLIISTAKTKLEWYDVPLFPFMSIIVALFIYFLYNSLQKVRYFQRSLAANAIPLIGLFLLFLKPYQNLLGKTYLPKEPPWHQEFYEIGYYLQEAVKGKHQLHPSFLLYDGYYGQNLFYLHLLQSKGVNIAIKDWQNLQAGDVVITHQAIIKQYIENHHAYEIIAVQGNVVKYNINS